MQQLSIEIGIELAKILKLVHQYKQFIINFSLSKRLVEQKTDYFLGRKEKLGRKIEWAPNLSKLDEIRFSLKIRRNSNATRINRVVKE